MTMICMALAVVWTVLSVAAYRLGLADGLSAARRGRLCGYRESKEDLLSKIDAYDGRKERHGS